LIDQIEGFLKFFPVNTFWKRGLSSVLLSWLAFVGQLSAADHFVDVLNNSFSPSSLQINVGDRVIWTNQDDDDDSHSATSNNGAWTGGLMVGFGDQFSVTFSSPGPFFYHDIFDGFSGSITVLAANTPPSVSITNPASGASFTAPVSFSIQASASDPGGSIANVEFFVDATSVGIDTTPNPYSASVTGLFAGEYTLYAVATDNLGAKATNSISISVTNPIIRLSAPKILSGEFQFAISGLVAGKTNLIQSSTNLTTWVSVRTNLATASVATFTNTQTAASAHKYFRVIQLP
jgi:plastocyanin